MTEIEGQWPAVIMRVETGCEDQPLRLDPHACPKAQSDRSRACTWAYSGAHACMRRQGHPGRCRCACGARYLGAVTP